MSDILAEPMPRSFSPGGTDGSHLAIMMDAIQVAGVLRHLCFCSRVPGEHAWKGICSLTDSMMLIAQAGCAQKMLVQSLLQWFASTENRI